MRLISEASHTALNIIRKSDLKPAMKRPQTSLQTARRLITTHLGTRSGISPEQNQKEREILRTARGKECLNFRLLQMDFFFVFREKKAS